MAHGLANDFSGLRVQRRKQRERPVWQVVENDVNLTRSSRRGAYSSWLNQIELWFSKIERDLLARGICTSVPDLARRIRTYIRQSNKQAKPIRWSYRNPAHRISSTSAHTVH